MIVKRKRLLQTSELFGEDVGEKNELLKKREELIRQNLFRYEAAQRKKLAALGLIPKEKKTK